jgi:hypothetical protein
MIVATFVIIISFAVFFFLFANVFTPLFVDIPATIKLRRKGLLKDGLVLKNYIKTVLIHSVVAFIISVLAYYFFIKYSFGFSVSMFIGACLALALSLWKMIWLLFRYSDNYSVWLDFYVKENMQHLDMTDRDVIAKALSEK